MDETTTVNETIAVEGETSYIGTDGTLSDGWHNQFVDAEHQKDTSWLGMKHVKDLTSRISHLQGKLTAAGKGFFPINDKSTPQQVTEFRQALNIPSTKDEYSIPTIPDEVKEFYNFDPDRLAHAKEIFHKHNLSHDQYVAVMSLFAEEKKAAAEAMKADPVAFFNEILPIANEKIAAETETKLRQKWGDAYDSRLAMANRAIEENTAPEDKEELLKFVGNNPLVADFLATVYNKHFTESHGVDTSLGEGMKSFSVDQRIAEINGQLTTELKQRNRTKFDELMSERERLYKTKFPQ